MSSSKFQDNGLKHFSFTWKTMTDTSLYVPLYSYTWTA